MAADSASLNRDRLLSPAVRARIEARFRQFMEQSHVPGLAYGVVANGELIAAGGMGVQNIDSRIPVTPDSVFRIASMSKSFTAMAVLKLRDDGRLQLGAPVAQIVPELADLQYPTRDSAAITVRQLLTMNAGLPQDDPWADRQLAAADATFSTWMKSGISFSNPPGVAYEYSNYGYAVLGRIVTVVSGMPYQRYVQEAILKPLGMSSSTFDVSQVAPERLAMGYRREENQWTAEPPLADGAFASMGGLFTTITDFARYMAFLLSAFPPRDEADNGPVRRSSLREMQQMARHSGVAASRAAPAAPALVLSDGYGYGLRITQDSILGYSVAHGGGLPGYGTFYRLLPDYGVGLVGFANLTYTSPGQRLTEILYDLRRAKTIQPRIIQPTPALLAVQDTLAQLYECWDDQTIIDMAAESFFLDQPLEKRREQFARLRADFGKCRAVTAIEPENALRGRWRMNCRSGRIELFVTLSPTMPPRLQYWQITAARKLTPAFREIAAGLVALINQWDDSQAKTLLDRRLRHRSARVQFDALRIQYGKLRLGEVLEGDGTKVARLRLLGHQGMVDMRLSIDPKRGKVIGLAFTRPRETSFVP